MHAVMSDRSREGRDMKGFDVDLKKMPSHHVSNLRHISVISLNTAGALEKNNQEHPCCMLESLHCKHQRFAFNLYIYNYIYMYV